MFLKDIRLYPIQVINNHQILFDDIADDLPDELKNYEIKHVDLIDNKLILEI
jgi:hypothetical protein